MKKVLLVMLALVILTSTVFAEEGIDSTPGSAETYKGEWATIGEALASEEYTGIRGSDEEYCVVIVKPDDTYIRLVAELDEKAKELNTATMEYVDVDSLFPMRRKSPHSQSPRKNWIHWRGKHCWKWKKRAMNPATPTWVKMTQPSIP